MPKVFVLGVDALSPVLVERWAEAGLLPNFQALMEDGSWGDLRSTGEFEQALIVLQDRFGLCAQNGDFWSGGQGVPLLLRNAGHERTMTI